MFQKKYNGTSFRVKRQINDLNAKPVLKKKYAGLNLREIKDIFSGTPRKPMFAGVKSGFLDLFTVFKRNSTKKKITEKTTRSRAVKQKLPEEKNVLKKSSIINNRESVKTEEKKPDKRLIARTSVPRRPFFRLPSIKFNLLRFSFRLPSFGGGSSRASSTGGGSFGTGGSTLYLVWSFIRRYYIAIIACFSIIIVVGSIFFVNYLKEEYKNVEALTGFQPNVVTRIYDRNGLLISELFTQKRDLVDYDAIPQNLIDAFIALEDNDFYQHYGVNPKGIIRAFFINLASGRVRQGGSTITQQLAKILLTDRERKLTRKIKEACIAIMIEFTYDKRKILEIYLNQIFLGHGAYGVEAASQLYFSKSVSELNLAECALLATLPSAPNRYSPIRHTKRSMGLHKVALARMVDLGFITVQQAEEAYLSFWPEYQLFINELSPSYNTWSLRVDEAPWVTEYVRRHIVDKFGEDAVYKEGLEIYTTFDLKKQLLAQQLMQERLREQTETSSKLLFTDDDFFTENFASELSFISLLFDTNPISRRGSFENKKFNDHMGQEITDCLQIVNYLSGHAGLAGFIDHYRENTGTDRFLLPVEGALVSINQQTGEIEAMVGGSRFSSMNQLNRVVQSYRQPGSSVKPLLYAAAVESRQFTAATAVLDAPIMYLDGDGKTWSPENYEGSYSGEVRLRRALAKSINVISVRIAETIGIGVVMDYYAKLFGMDKESAEKRINRNLSIALGTVEVTPLEMARSYAVMANGGKAVIPYGIRYIKDRDGKVIENREEEVKKELEELTKNKKIQLIEPATASIMISMMRTVVEAGTGISANPGRPAGGKTGTTNNWRDAWFVGFTPELTTSIWIGYDSLGMSLGRGQTGGNVAAPLWGAYMRGALVNYPVKDFPHYAELEHAIIARESGLRPGSGCTDVMEEIFIPGTVPTEIDTMCGSYSSGRELLAREPEEDITASHKVMIDREIGSTAPEESSIADIGLDLLD